MTELTLERLEEKEETEIKEIFKGSTVDTSLIQEELAFEKEINSIFNPVEPTSPHTEELDSKENVTTIPPIEETFISNEDLTLKEKDSANDEPITDTDIIEPDTKLEIEDATVTESEIETETKFESVHIPEQVINDGNNSVRAKEKPIKEPKITLSYLAKNIFSKEIRYNDDLLSVMEGHWEFKKGKSVKSLYKSIKKAREENPLDVPLIKEALKSHLVKVKK